MTKEKDGSPRHATAAMLLLRHQANVPDRQQVSGQHQQKCSRFSQEVECGN
jgi:hypothetical protein